MRKNISISQHQMWCYLQVLIYKFCCVGRVLIYWRSLSEIIIFILKGYWVLSKAFSAWRWLSVLLIFFPWCSLVILINNFLCLQCFLWVWWQSNASLRMSKLGTVLTLQTVSPFGRFWGRMFILYVAGRSQMKLLNSVVFFVG